MLSFTVWSMIESISIWLTGYIDIFIIGIYLTPYYLGIYKTSMTIVGQITALITSATTPILFSALSRLQNERNAFMEMFFNFQKLVGLLVIPLGVGIFVFRDFVTDILLGNQWIEAANFIGLWALTSAVTIVLSHYSSEVYRSLGQPKLSVLSQFLHIIVLCPAMLIAVNYSFEIIYVTRSLIRIEGILVNLIIMYYVIKVSPLQMIVNIVPAILAALVMGVVGYILLFFDDSLWWSMLIICICMITYLSVIMLFRQERNILFSLKTTLMQKKAC